MGANNPLQTEVTKMTKNKTTVIKRNCKSNKMFVTVPPVSVMICRLDFPYFFCIHLHEWCITWFKEDQ